MGEHIFEGPEGKLEGRLELPEGSPRGCAVICHPHPLFGGTFQNTICVRAARALRGHGFATLRFNFRGVGKSEGVHDGEGGEEGDVRAALDELYAQLGRLPAWAVGYSFGARTVCGLAARDNDIERTVLIALPLRTYGPGRLLDLRQETLMLFGNLDEHGTEADLPVLKDHIDVRTIEGADHFFRGRTPLVEEHIHTYAKAKSFPKSF